MNIFYEADFREIGAGRQQTAGYLVSRGDLALLLEERQREKAAFSRDDGIFAALSGFHDYAVERAHSLDGGGEFMDAFVRFGSADIALPGEQVLERDIDGFELL